MSRTRIMLVEDDKSLREIYGVRLYAEGYDIISAGDGEEALALAIKERPQLIISDVMMPKISGFDMLDILRSTTETKNVKVIMMTALGSEDQRERGQALGADRYLVKSQVGIEDVVKVVHEILADQGGTAPSQPASQQQAPQQATPSAPQQQPQSQPQAQGQPPAATRSAIPTSAVSPRPAASATPPAPSPYPQTPAPSASKQGSSIKTRVIQPLNDPHKDESNIGDLVERELSAGNPTDTSPTAESAPPQVPTVSVEQERALVDSQLNQYAAAPQPPAPPASPVDSTLPPNITINTDGTIGPSPASPQQPQS